MAVKKKHKTTVLFLNHEQNRSKSVQIHSLYVKHWKKIAMAVIFLFIGLVTAIFSLINRHQQIEATNLALHQKLEHQRVEFSQLDTNKIRKQYLSIDEKLNKINKFLKARGLKTLTKNQGGESTSDLGTTEEIGSFYEEYLKKMANILAFTPLGYPHRGMLSSTFGHRENPFTGEGIEGHKGLDIRGKYGENVKTTANGIVKLADWNGGYGKCVIINHGNGFETTYGHLSSISVKKGQYVSVGTVIGKIGSTGRSTGPHLHYEIHKNGKILNPKLYLNLE